MKKSIFKVVITTVAVISLSAAAHAQNGRFSLGLEAALPMGDFGDNAGTGFGASLRYEHPLADKLGLTGTVGYITFGKKTVDLGPFGKYEYKNSMIPVQAGLKYYFQEAQEGFYVMAELGVHVFSAKVTVPSYTLLGTTIPESSSTDSKTNLSYAPEIGYHLANLDFGVRYQLFSYETTVSNGLTTTSKTTTQGYLGIRAAYVFGSK